MKIVVGLGNPGKQYEKTRHNVGFMVIDKVLEKLNLTLDQEDFNGHFVTYRYKGEKILFVKPQTYMNLSGECVSKMMSFYKIGVEDLLVIHDDLDLPLGKLRLRTSGSSGGQKGMGNIINLLGSSNIKRIRVGISNNKQMDTADYVLGKFSKEDMTILEESLNKAADAIIYHFDEPDFNKVMSKFN